MKKIMFSVFAVIAFAGTSFSQKATLDNPWSLEGVLMYSNPGGISWSAPTIRARYFVNENIAGRVQLGIGDGMGTPRSESYTYYENADGTGESGTLDITRLSWMAQIGGEYHLTGTSRLSPYFGLGINFGGGSETQTGEKYDYFADDFDKDMSFESDGKYSMFGVGLLAGMDFYVLENIYLGLELGFNFSSFNYGDQTLKITDASTSPSTTMTMVGAGWKEGYMSTGAGSAAFRLGWRF